MSDTATIMGYGLIGCGNFGRFCLEQYADVDAIKRVAVADVDQQAARETAARFGVAASASIEAMLDRPDVDLVHIATPPTTHKDIAMAALEAGKHVLCEKPLATNHADGRAMVEAATRTNRRLTVNLIMRYDPMCQAVKRILEDHLLGDPLHAIFENYAKDEPLPPEHWFWDRARSGGIFVEHGVHFFDLFEMWFGPGQVRAAQQSIRPRSNGIVEQVNCTVAYGPTVLANFYHGFHQTERMDRQEIRIVCERGTMLLFDWVPTRMAIDCMVDENRLERLNAILPQAKLEQLDSYGGDSRRVTSRHKTYDVDGRFRISANMGLSKTKLYGQVLRALIEDQLIAIRDPNHLCLVDEQNGLSCLEIATWADKLARGLSFDERQMKQTDQVHAKRS